MMPTATFYSPANFALTRFLGRSAPFSFGDLVYVYCSRDLPVVAVLLALGALLDPRPDITVEAPLMFFLLAVVLLPTLETAIFIILALLVPRAWYEPDITAKQSPSRILLVSLAGGVLFGALHSHLDDIVITLSAAWGGTIMFAVLLIHWSQKARDRGIVMCWVLHVGHNGLFITLALTTPPPY